MRWIRTAILIVCMMALAASGVYGASENSVDRTLSVKSDYQFTPTKAYVYFRIQEKDPNDFSGGPVTFVLKLNNADWFEAGEPAGDAAGPDQMELDTLKSDAGSGISIRRLTRTKLEVTLTRAGAATDEAWWKIPIYAEVTDAAMVSLEVDGLDSMVTSGTYPFADANSTGSTGIKVGHVFSGVDAHWIVLREQEPGQFATPQTFSLLLTNAKWRPVTDKALGPEGILKDAGIGGIEGAQVVAVNRISDTELEITVVRGTEGSMKGIASFSLPLYCEVTAVGDVTFKVDSKNSKVNAMSFSKTKVVDPIRYKTKVTLTLNKKELAFEKGAESKTYPLDVAPINPNGNTLVPVRGIYEHLGNTVSWDAASRTVSIKTEDQIIMIPIGNPSMLVNGNTVTLQEPAQIIDNRTYLPLRAISEQLGMKVTWIEATQQILIEQE